VRRRSVLLLAALLVVVVFATASAGASRATAKPSGSITVSAAASLTEAFTAIGEKFQKQNPKATVTFNFGSSSNLVTQILGGAPADVYASADLTTMDELVAGGQVTDTPTPFARNEMQIAVKPGNPMKVTSVANLAKLGTVSLCGATVPCGVYAGRVLKKADVTIPESSVTRGVDAKATIAAVAQGDANAAIVYATDVMAAGTTVAAVDIPADQNVIAVYPIAPIESSSNPRLASAFVMFVASPAGQKILAKYGFLAV
jgi:molybdate transport system substrate-binding protein